MSSSELSPAFVSAGWQIAPAAPFANLPVPLLLWDEAYAVHQKRLAGFTELSDVPAPVRLHYQ